MPMPMPMTMTMTTTMTLSRVFALGLQCHRFVVGQQYGLCGADLWLIPNGPLPRTAHLPIQADLDLWRPLRACLDTAHLHLRSHLHLCLRLRLCSDASASASANARVRARAALEPCWINGFVLGVVQRTFQRIFQRIA